MYEYPHGFVRRSETVRVDSQLGSLVDISNPVDGFDIQRISVHSAWTGSHAHK